MLYNKSGQSLISAYSLTEAISAAFDIEGNQVFSNGSSSIKIMSYNVGSWTAFGRNATAANQETYYTLQNAIFAQEQVSLAGIQEYYNKIGTYDVPTMLAQYLPYLYAVNKQSSPTKAGRAIASKYELTNTQEINFQNQNGEIRSYLIADVRLNGKNVKFLTAHLALVNETILLQIQELLQAVSNFDYWILTGDFNIAFPNAESTGYNYLVKPFLDAGYHVANGSDFGFIPTFSPNAAGNDTDWRVLDNIMCSANIDITEVYVNEEKLTNPTGDGIDHLPLIAELTIN